MYSKEVLGRIGWFRSNNNSWRKKPSEQWSSIRADPDQYGAPQCPCIPGVQWSGQCCRKEIRCLEFVYVHIKTVYFARSTSAKFLHPACGWEWIGWKGNGAKYEGGPTYNVGWRKIQAKDVHTREPLVRAASSWRSGLSGRNCQFPENFTSPGCGELPPRPRAGKEG